MQYFEQTAWTKWHSGANLPESAKAALPLVLDTRRSGKESHVSLWGGSTPAGSSAPHTPRPRHGLGREPEQGKWESSQAEIKTVPQKRLKQDVQAKQNKEFIHPFPGQAGVWVSSGKQGLTCTMVTWERKYHDPKCSPCCFLLLSPALCTN